MPDVGYSRGSSIIDNHPQTRSVPSFGAFVNMLKSQRAADKARAGYFCGPLNGDGHRCAEGAQPRLWIAVDLDRIHRDIHADVRQWFGRFSACGWATHSSTPEAPRERVVIELSRLATRAECMEIGRVLMHDLGEEFGDDVLVDPSTFRGEQPVFLAPTKSEFVVYAGIPLSVDALLETASALPEGNGKDTTAQAPAGWVPPPAGRNDELSREAFRLRKNGYEPQAIEPVLLAMNARWENPLPVAEVHGIAFRKARIQPEPPPEQEGTAPRPPVPMLDIRQLREASVNVAWTVKHILPSDSVGMMFGASGTYKSFVAIDLALHIAHGINWLGRKTCQGPVIYIAAEGGTGMWRRIQAWHLARNIDLKDNLPFFVVTTAVQLNTAAADVVSAAAALNVVPRLVIIDTMSQTNTGEENSASETAGYFREVNSWFRALWRCSVMVIHHTGHSATERPRGSSSITANNDYLFAVWREEQEYLCTVECVKQRDGDSPDPVTFELTAHTTGIDEDGDDVRSLSARHLANAKAMRAVIDGNKRRGRPPLGLELFLSNVQTGAPYGAARMAFYAACSDKTEEAKKRAWNRALGQAKAMGFVEIVNGEFLVYDGGTE